MELKYSSASCRTQQGAGVCVNVPTQDTRHAENPWAVVLLFCCVCVCVCMCVCVCARDMGCACHSPAVTPGYVPAPHMDSILHSEESWVIWGEC